MTGELPVVNEVAAAPKAPAPMMGEALSLYRMLVRLSHAELDTAAVLKLYGWGTSHEGRGAPGWRLGGPFARRGGMLQGEPSPQGGPMKSVAQLLKIKGTRVYSIPPGASVLECLKLFADKRIGAALVMERDRLLGIFTERDYARKVALQGKSSKDVRVQDVMTADVLWVGPERTNEECMALMTEKRIRHLPVMENGKVIGIISIGDLVKDIIAEQQFVIEHLERYIMGGP
jgi:CBS domain-containing protein